MKRAYKLDFTDLKQRVDIHIEDGIDPSQVKSEALMWLAETAGAACEYGSVEKVEGTFRVIARDPFKGVLVEKVWSS